MKLTEHRSKRLLRERGVDTPRGELATTPEEVAAAAARLGGRVAVKAQVRSGGRGKAGGIAVVESAAEAALAARDLLGMELGREVVSELLVEEAVDIAEERYLAITVDTSLGRPIVMTSDRGGIDVESMPDDIERAVVPADASDHDDPLVRELVTMFAELDALLIEINPLAITTTGDVVALDAKIELDDSAARRHPGLFAEADDAEPQSHRERAAAELGLRLIELGGDVALLANGAGLTMATMDAVVHAGGHPANFLEIGGDAYTKATPALELVLAQPGVRSLLVNFCGAFARCDVMTAGVLEAWTALEPDIPVSFSISGTGQDEARDMVRRQLGIEPHESMADAVVAAVGAART